MTPPPRRAAAARRARRSECEDLGVALWLWLFKGGEPEWLEPGCPRLGGALGGPSALRRALRARLLGRAAGFML